VGIINNTDILNEVIEKFNAIEKKINDPMIFEPFYKDFSYRFCWSSNAIEGNTLSLDETISIVEYDEVNDGHAFTEYKEAKLLYKAIDEKLYQTPQSISEEWIQSVNAIITDAVGEYRQKNLYIGTLVEATYYPPDYEKVPELMKEFLQTVNFQCEDKKDVIPAIAEQHIKFERIHPFVDGNGRTGRMILNQQMMNHGFLPLTIEGQSKYRQAFRAYDQNNDLSLLVHLICRGEIASISRVEELAVRLNDSI